MPVDLLVAADFDGTLAPICPDPAAPVIDPPLASFLRRAAAAEGLAVGIISGRELDDLARRVRGLQVYLAGSHGLEIASPRGERIREAPALDAAPEPALLREIAAAGIRVERKKHGIALHWRTASGVDAAHPAVAAFRSWAEAEGLRPIAGRAVLEARAPGGGKEDALRYLTLATGAKRVLYAGDDLTDFAALRFAAARGRAFFVASDERDPPPAVTVARDRDELLRMMIEEVARSGRAVQL